MLVELGLSVTSYQPLMDEARATVTRLAQRTGGVGFFYLLSGCDFVCAGRVENSPNPGMLNEEGCRRPLIMSAGGVAMLLAMPAAERDVLVARNLRDVADMHIPQLDRFERMLARALQLDCARCVAVSCARQAK